MAEAERRIEMIALDIAEHFKATIRPNASRRRCGAERAAALRNAEAHLNNFGLSAYPIITAVPTTGRSSARRAISTTSKSPTRSSTLKASRRFWSSLTAADRFRRAGGAGALPGSVRA